MLAMSISIYKSTTYSQHIYLLELVCNLHGLGMNWGQLQVPLLALILLPLYPHAKRKLIQRQSYPQKLVFKLTITRGISFA